MNIKNTQEITLKTEFITLGQLLKFSNLVKSGGEVKSFLNSTLVTVNSEKENRRGRKLYKNDVIECNEVKIILK